MSIFVLLVIGAVIGYLLKVYMDWTPEQDAESTALENRLQQETGYAPTAEQPAKRKPGRPRKVA